MCDCIYFDGEGCTLEDYASGQSEDLDCLHGTAEFDEDMDAYTGDILECDRYTTEEEEE